MANKDLPPIIIKKKKKGDHDVHSTAWKIALADFMTALMCFFLVMWLTTILNTDTKPDTSRFFNLSGIDETDVGIGGVLGGSTITTEGPLSEMAAEFTVTPPMGAVDKNDAEILGRYLPEDTSQGPLPGTEQHKTTAAAYATISHKIQHAFGQKGQKQIKIVKTPEGLKIDLLESYDKPMFRTGKSQILPDAQKALRKVANILSAYKGQLTIQGHTDTVRFQGRGYTNWELSTDRANAARRYLKRVAPSLHIDAVIGKGAKDLHDVEGEDASNRRISLFFKPEAHTSTKHHQHDDPIHKLIADSQIENNHKHPPSEDFSRNRSRKLIKYFV